MGVEQFGIDVDVKVDTGDSQSKVRELAEQLEGIKKFKDSKMSVDLGLSKIDTKKIGSLIALMKQMEGSNFSKAFEVSDKSLKSLQQLRETAEQIAKLSKNQTKLINDDALSETTKKPDELINKYKQAQKEIKTLQSQMSKTKDDQVLSALLGQLDKYKSKLDTIYGMMNSEQQRDIMPLRTKNIEELERIYGKVFDSIQNRAREFQNKIEEISKSDLIDKGQLQKTKELLESITKLNFKNAQQDGYKPFSDALQDLEKLKKGISDLNKGSKLDGFNQSDLVKEWKNIQNIMTSVKKDMANTTDKSSSQALSKKMKELNKELEKCYTKMSDVDKKTVDMISKFDKIKLDNSFTKGAEKLLGDVKKLDTALDSIEKKDVFDGRKLNGYKTQLKNITESLDKNILEGTLDEKYLSKTKTKLESLKTSFKELGEVAEKSLKISGFSKGMEKQFDDIKSKFKDLNLDKDIEKIRKEFDKLDSTPIEKLPSAFESINNKIQELRKNAESTSKVFKEYDTVTKTLGEVGDKFNKLNGSKAFNDKEVLQYQQRIESLVKSLSQVNLKDAGASSSLDGILKDARALQSELKEVKIPDLVSQWKKLNTELLNYKKALSTAHDDSSIGKLEGEIKRVESEITSLIQKMNTLQKSDVDYLNIKSDRELSEYFRKEADKSIKEIDSISLKLKELGNKDITDVSSIERITRALTELKTDLRSGIELGSLDANGLRTFNSLISGSKSEVNSLEKALKEMSKSANTNNLIKEYKQLSNELNKAQSEMSKMKTPEGFAHWEKEINKVSKSMTELRTKMSSSEIDIANKIDTGALSKLSNTFSKQIDKIRADASGLSDVLSRIGDVGAIDTSSLNRLESEIKNITKALNNEGLSGRQLAELKNRLQSVTDEIKGFEKVGNFTSKIESELKQLESIASSPATIQGIKKTREELEKLLKMPAGSNGIEKQMDRINSSLKTVQSTVKRTTDSFFDDFYGSLRTFTMGNLLGDAIQRGVYAMKDTLVGLDSALRDMMKVAPADFSGTSSQLKQIKNEAIETAKAVGTSSEDVIQGMSKALQTGAKTMQDALEIAKQSTIYANVGDLDQGTADTYIASTMSAFYGMDKALAPVQNRIQGMGKDYNNLTNMIDLANYAG